MPFIVEYAYLPDDVLKQLIRSNKVVLTTPNPMLMSMLWTVLPFVALALLFWFILVRQIKMPARAP